MIVERGERTETVDQVLTVSRDMLNDYPDAPLDQLLIATLKGSDGDSVLGYYDGKNIAINDKFFNEAMETAYVECVKAGFHPSNGNKTGLQAVAAQIKDAHKRFVKSNMDLSKTEEKFKNTLRGD